MSNTVVYYILHEKTNSVYVGSTRRWGYSKKANGKQDGGRKSEHKTRLRTNTHQNKYLQKLWNEHEETEFQFIVYGYYEDSINRQELFDHEEELRKKFHGENKTVLNVQGTSDYSRSAEHRAQISEINKGSKNGRAKLKEKQVRVIRRRIANGESYQKIAKDFGITKSTISDIKIGRKWAWLE